MIHWASSDWFWIWPNSGVAKRKTATARNVTFISVSLGRSKREKNVSHAIPKTDIRVERARFHMRIMPVRLHYQNEPRKDSIMQRLFALFLAIPLLLATAGTPVFATAPSRTVKS